MTDSMKFGPEWLRNLSETPVQPQPVRYQLAEFRYGREEMLALYSSSLAPPESLKNLPGLYVEKAQPPLALNTMTDEETRMWNRGINSDAVLRSGKGGEGRGAMRGAGGSGRGRGRGGTGPAYYGRGGGIEPGGPRGPGGGYEDDIGYSRPTRPFDRSQSYMGGDQRRGESWAERNGGEGRGGGRTEVSNWRRVGRQGGEEDDWRPPKWSMSGRTNSGNWREEDSWDPMPHSKGNHHLPEWATEKNSEGGGTFDSSGAFRPTDGMGDEEEKGSRLALRKSSSASKPPEPEPPRADKDPRKSSGDGGRDDESASAPSHKPVTEPPSEPPQKEPPPSSPSPAPTPPQAPEQLASHPDDKPPTPSPSLPPVSLSPSHLLGGSSPSKPLMRSPLAPGMSPLAPGMSPLAPGMSPLAPGMPPLSPALDQPPPPIHPFHQSPLAFTKPPPVSDPLLEDALSHMTDDIAADLVAKLMEDEENKDKQWYYRDPQGQVQGPFSCNEMAEWFESGYFTLNLLVRRACDPNYAPLGDLIKLWGCIPFLPEQHPLNKEAAAMVNSHQHVQENLMLAQYQNYQRALLLRQQQAAAAVRAGMHPGKLPHDWIDQVPPPSMVDQVLPPQYQPQGAPPQVAAHLANTNSNNLRALLAQMQQQTLQRAPAPKAMPVPRTTEEISRKVSDFLRGLQAKSEAQQAQAQQAPPGPPGAPGVMETLLNLQQQPSGPSPIQNLLRHMQAQQQVKMQQQQQQQQQQVQQQQQQVQQQQQQQQQQQVQQQPQQHIGPQHPNAAQVDSVWNSSNWNQWGHLNAKGIKTEQQVLEEQLRAEDDRKREEMRKQGEVQRKAVQEAVEEVKAKQEMVATIVEEKMREMRKAEELARRRQEEEDLRRKQEASRRAEVERQRKGEEKRKKDEEKRKKEEEKKEKEKERLRVEEERKKKEAEEAKKRAAADVMAKVQRAQWCPPPVSNTSLLEIQRSEREQQLRSLQQQQQQMEAQQQQAQSASKAASMQLKWSEAQRQIPPVESLDAIQAEQRQYLKQLEKEKAEREKEKQAQQQNVSSGALGSWSQGLTWGSSLTGSAWQAPVNPVTNSSSAPNVPSGGFWDSVGAPAPPPKAPGSLKPGNGGPSPPQSQPPNKESKNKAKRDEMAVMKLFTVNSSSDEFTQWCTQTLSNIQSGALDIPTFVTFLRDVESAEEVRDYIKMYLGDSKEAADFARQFIERRRSESHPGGQPPSPTPTNQDFQQVKGKNKKGKKGRMQRVDSRILNFSTTSASDRINVGDRQYPDFE